MSDNSFWPEDTRPECDIDLGESKALCSKVCPDGVKPRHDRRCHQSIAYWWARVDDFNNWNWIAVQVREMLQEQES